MNRFIPFLIVLIASGCSSREPLVVIDGADSPESSPIAAENDTTSDQDVYLRGQPPVAVGDDYFCNGYWCKENPIAFPEVTSLLAGNEAFRAGNTRRALEKWREVIRNHPDTPESNLAILNCGRVLRVVMALCIGVRRVCQRLATCQAKS